MPTYEYQCRNCGNLWEELQKISEPALDTCPKCHEKSAQRLISGGNFILKGGGWYADLYSSSSGGNKKSESTAPAKSESKSEGAGSSSSDSASTSSAPAAAPTPTSTPDKS